MADLLKVFSGAPSGVRWYGVVGWPLDYSLSPAMHNAALSHFKFPATYRAVRVPPDEWDGFARALLENPGPWLEGLNVTLPYKEAVFSLPVKIEGPAAECHAANTLVREPGGWMATNTDGAGFLEDLRENHVAWEGKKVVLLGAGGAARAALFALGRHARSVALLNRSRDRALSLAKDFCAAGGRAEVQVNPNREEALATADLLVNATSVGLKEGDPCPVPRETLRRDLTVYDMIYHRETALVEASRETGALAVGGIGMLVNQGALAFELWFQKDLKKVKYDPRILRQIMGDAARSALKGRNAQ